MSDTLAFLLQYGYVILYACVLAEQVGLPVPAVPVLLGMGALAGAGEMSLPLALGVVLAASLPPDLVWYELGRRRGPRVLARICAISLEPDWCVRRTESMFIRFGRKLLLVAKFLPGLSAVASPLAGSAGVARWQFVLLDVTGALLWAGTWLGMGYAFSEALDGVDGGGDKLPPADRFGGGPPQDIQERRTAALLRRPARPRARAPRSN